jgi:hypothetical protein
MTGSIAMIMPNIPEYINILFLMSRERIRGKEHATIMGKKKGP